MSNQFMMPSSSSVKTNKYMHATKIKHSTILIDPYKWKEPIKWTVGGLINYASELTADNFIVAYEYFGVSTDGTGGLNGEGTYSWDSSKLTITYTPGNNGGGIYCNAPLYASLYYCYGKKRVSLGQKTYGNYNLSSPLSWDITSLADYRYMNSSDFVPTLSRYYKNSSESFMIYGFDVNAASNGVVRVWAVNPPSYQNCSLAVSLMAFV